MQTGDEAGGAVRGSDPLLVRPYISQKSNVAGQPAATWPESAVAAVAPGPVEAETTVLPVVALDGAPARPRRRVVLLLAAGVGAVVLAGAAAAGIVASRPDPGGRVALPPDLPSTRTATTDAVAAPSAPQASGGVQKTGAAGADGRSAPVSKPVGGKTSAARTTSPTVKSATSAPAETVAPATTGALAPITTRVGRLVSGGLCLDVDQGVAAEMKTCSGTSDQVWTLNSDGTLLALGKCGQTSGGGGFALGSCFGSDTEKWQVGAGASLVNVATGTCLTGGTTAGFDVRMSACTGAATQAWALSS
ncbi:hypothetical protein GCM10010435_49410 [Winogradskya consettensis]|uniref:Ricin B lectin domain-containing protein n=1 Tax=Winogradskya consettensis TaxID=113560 RepID=A0A919W154_9ACTN|nr:ricin-type beta-trefoil lectin domain protein [Actinoplanes consettensis]GIM85397.1 hypothetical protein Aco04nite_96080 [Actinoplanes consettensis]